MQLLMIQDVLRGNRDVQIFARCSQFPRGSRTAVLADCFTGLHARGADVLTLGDSANECTDALDIWVPATTCLTH